MDSGRGKSRRMNVKSDRLSSLPDDLIHKILSSFNTKDVVQTSVLSSRWRFVWTSLSHLNFSTKDCDKLSKFSKFVTHVLSCRNNEIELSSVKLSFRGKAGQMFVKRILKYALSHNVQHLTITHACLPPYDEVEFPDYLFRSRSLKHLTIAGRLCKLSIMSTSSWELPSLTTLYFKDIEFYDEITDKCIGVFSKCANLKNLTINGCSMREKAKLYIRHPSLCNLTVTNTFYCYNNVLNVVAPQLKNLTIRKWSRVHVRCANKLVSFVFEGSLCLKLSPYGLPSLEKLDLCIYGYLSNKEHAHKIVDLLQQVHNAKFLTLNMEILQVLSSFKEVISHQTSPFDNLKCLKVYPHDTSPKVQETIPTEVENYLLESSPSATFTMVSYEEMRALNNVTSAQSLIAELQALLEQENREINKARMDRCKAPTENHKANMHELGNAQVDKVVDNPGSMTQIDMCWKDMISVQIERGEKKIKRIISELHRIEGLLKKLPASKRDKIQPCFSSLCSEAHSVTNKIMHCMITKFNEKQSKLSVCFNELAKPPQPSA